MSRRDSAPTIGWVLTSSVNKFLALLLVFLLLIAAAAGAYVYYALRNDCTRPIAVNLHVFNYFVQGEVRTTCGS